MDVRAFNRHAWDKQVEQSNPYTKPASPEVIAAARQGQWQISLTDTKPVPQAWFPDLTGLDILGLAASGGQQGPILAVAGGQVTVFDNSPKQLAQDRAVADREGLDIRLVEGDMADLSIFADGSFDLIVHPISNVFVPDVGPVWAEAYRVLRPRGIMLAGFMNPVEFIFDFYRLDNDGVLEVKYPLPFAGTSLSEAERERDFGRDAPLEFSHTFDDLIGGQLAAGFMLTGFYEDYRQDGLPISKYMPSFFATRAIKP